MALRPVTRRVDVLTTKAEQRTPRPDLRVGPDTVSLQTVRGWSERFLSLSFSGDLVLTSNRSLLRTQVDWKLRAWRCASAVALGDDRLRFTDVDAVERVVRLESPACSTVGMWLAALRAAHFNVEAPPAASAAGSGGGEPRLRVEARAMVGSGLFAGVSSPLSRIDFAHIYAHMVAAAAAAEADADTAAGVLQRRRCVHIKRAHFCSSVEALGGDHAAVYGASIFDVACEATKELEGYVVGSLSAPDAAAALSMVSNAHHLGASTIDALFDVLAEEAPLSPQTVGRVALERYLTVALALLHPSAGLLADAARRALVARSMAKQAVETFGSSDNSLGLHRSEWRSFFKLRCMLEQQQ